MTADTRHVASINRGHDGTLLGFLFIIRSGYESPRLGADMIEDERQKGLRKRQTSTGKCFSPVLNEVFFVKESENCRRFEEHWPILEMFTVVVTAQR